MPPNPADPNSRLRAGVSSMTLEKRSREEDEDGARVQKRERPSGDDDGEEMELEDDEDQGAAQQPSKPYSNYFFLFEASIHMDCKRYSCPDGSGATVTAIAM